MTQNRCGVYAGSFDPLTSGHLDILQKSLSVLDRLVIGVGIHACKEPLLSAEQRCALITSVLQTAIPAHRVPDIHVVSFDGLLVHFAKSQGACVLVRGLRHAADFQEEKLLANMNLCIDPTLETIFFMASSRHQDISSTLVRQLISLKENIRPFVPEQVALFFEQKW